MKAGDGNRTHVSSLEGWCSTIEPHLRFACSLARALILYHTFAGMASTFSHTCQKYPVYLLRRKMMHAARHEPDTLCDLPELCAVLDAQCTETRRESHLPYEVRECLHTFFCGTFLSVLSRSFCAYTEQFSRKTGKLPRSLLTDVAVYHGMQHRQPRSGMMPCSHSSSQTSSSVSACTEIILEQSSSEHSHSS